MTLAGVEGAEDAVRRILRLTPEENMRVRVMAMGAAAAAMIEVDAGRLAGIEDDPGTIRELEEALRVHGLDLTETRAFKSGSVAKQLGGGQ